MSSDQSRLIRACVGFAALLLAAGCGGSVSESAPEPIALPDLAATWAAAVCDAEAPCCAAAQIAYDPESCRQTATASYRARIQRFDDGYTRYDASAARTCINAWVEQAQSCMAFTLATDQSLAACALMFNGTQPDGAACNGGFDCASKESTCVGTLGQGVCTHDLYPLTHGALGAQCGSTCALAPCEVEWPARPPPVPFGTGCYREDGLVCGASGVCAAPAQLGAPCAPYGCAEGAFCEARQCVPQRDSGPCDNTEVACSSASYCVDGQCQLKQPDGNACTNLEACQGQCDLPLGVGPEVDGGLSSENVPTAGMCIEATFASRQHCAGEL